MSTIHEQRHHFAPLVIQPSLSQVVIAGDIQLFVTEMEATYGPIIGRYRIETPQMQEPLQVLWGSEGQVCNRQARETDIVFEIPQARAGQLWIYAVQAQVTYQETSIVTGMFVQILVTPDTLPQLSA